MRVLNDFEYLQSYLSSLAPSVPLFDRLELNVKEALDF